MPLIAFWLVLSGRYEPKYVILGVLSVSLVILANRDIAPILVRFPSKGEKAFAFSPGTYWRFVGYLPWLLYSIAVANLQVLWVVIHPKLPIDPRLLRFRTMHQSAAAQVVLANSITLTPGTITVDLVDGEYTIHAIMPASAESLLTAEMQNRVAAVFGEEREETPAVSWTPERKESVK